MPQLLVTINDQAMLPKVRSAIRSLRGVSSVTIPRTPLSVQQKLSASQKRQLERLKELEQLEDNWDDDGAIPIEPATVANVKSIIVNGDAKLLEQWVIFPDTNGTIELTARHRNAVISIGNNDFSYVYHGKNHDEMVSHEEADVSVLTHLIRRINKNE